MAPHNHHRGKENAAKKNATTKKKKNVAKKPPPKKTPAAAAAPPLPQRKRIPREQFQKPVTVSFPYFAADCACKVDGSDGGIFPPTIHTDVEYARGIRLFPTTFNGTTCSVTYTNYLHHNSHKLVKPVLSQVEAQLWTHKFAAKTAVHLQYPVSCHRLLGTITRRVTTPMGKSAPVFTRTKSASSAARYPQVSSQKQRIEPAAAKREVAREKAATGAVAAAGDDDDDCSLKDEDARVAKIQSHWKTILCSDAEQQQLSNKIAPWDCNGALLNHHDPEHVPVKELLRWLKTMQEDDEHYYCDDDLVAILMACQDLMDPNYLWNIPLLMVYPVVTTETSARTDAASSKPKKRAKRSETKYTIRLGIYCHRLLAEATTTSLKTVMDALDKGSFFISQPLYTPPSGQPPVFESSPYPIVCVDDDDDDDVERNADDDWMGKTRDDKRISAFTTKGLLKLLENTGTDTSDFAKIQQPLTGSFQMDLMLHQEHAIAWMVQMESLDGFGINSILWEERQFLDGGKYYYCPSLGNMRLDPPQRMHGGLLCDEMGLGKTIEILGLILATLPELKREAQATDGCHSTLIIVPPALVAQWQSEIVKATGDSLTVDYFDFRTQEITRRGPAEEADIVITTYNALERPSSARQLHEVSWGRIVLDEMQEIRSSTSKIAKSCEKLNCARRWMVSGTPLFSDDIEDFRGELNFLRLEPFGANTEDGFFKFMISDPWENHEPDCIERLKVLSSVMLRRSKSMTIKATGAPLLGLKPLTVEFSPVPQTNSERALYCFIESIVSRELRTKNGSKVNTKLCLRLLRDTCNSAILLNGGLNVTSQLKDLNRLVIQEARRANVLDNDADSDDETAVRRRRIRVLSCDDAILHLAQLQEATRAGEDEVAGLQLGFGGGISRRARARDSAEQKLAEAEETLNKASMENKQAKARKARALWHLALEKVTMGELPLNFVRSVGTKYRSLWCWRYLTARLARPDCVLPIALRRGWRPSLDLVRNWHTIHPEFFWAHPGSFQLDCIPNEVTVEDITKSISDLLLETGGPDSRDATGHALQVIVLGKSTTWTWKAGMKFDSTSEADLILKKASKKSGICLSSALKVPCVEERIDATRKAYDEAVEADSVHPCDRTRENIRKTKKAYQDAEQGLRIVRSSKTHDECSVLLSPARKPFRSQSPDYSHLLYDSLDSIIENCSFAIASTAALMASEQRKITKFRRAALKGINEDVQAMSAFDSLQALRNGEPELTSCSICLMQLGDDERASAKRSASISMTKCGHLYCRGCLHDYMADHQRARHLCPCCRKEFHAVDDIVHIDPSKTDHAASLARVERAKRIVHQASRMLEESNGQLDPSMWEQLYNSIDVPEGVNDSRDIRVSALPRHFLAHLRNATGLPVHSDRSETVANLDSESTCLSSKVKALLRDLPSNERSVVFSSSKTTIKHLQFVLDSLGIGCRALFSGEKVEDSELAVTEWQSSNAGNSEKIPYPILLVQAGAAASGLTLTSACKMFLMEPFVRYEEEAQAYARCHRYGQQHAVHCKVYFAPVSVESRLLEWRKRAVNNGGAGSAQSASLAVQDTNIVYSTLDADDDEDESDTEDEEEDVAEEEETNQTRFLLGLHNEASGVPVQSD